MTTPIERTRSLVWAGAFLVEVARDKNLPVGVRRSAAVIARHFPTTLDLRSINSAPVPWMEIASQEDLCEWLQDFPLGPLLDSTRLGMPSEDNVPTRKQRRSRQKPHMVDGLDTP